MDAESKIRILISSVLSAKGFEDASASTEKLKQKTREATSNIRGMSLNFNDLEKSAKSVIAPLEKIKGIIAAYGAGTAIKSLIDINAQFESMQTGISALIAVNAQNETSTGRAISASEKFTLAQKMAIAAVEELRKANVDTPASLAQLTDGFQSAIGPALKLNWTIDQTIKYTTLMTQAAAAMGMPMNQLAQEMRSVLSGQIDMNSQVARNLGITNEQIALHMKLGDTYDFLSKKLQDFEEAGKKIRTDWDGVTSDLEDRFASIRKVAGNKLFEALKIDLAEVSNLLEKNTDQIAGEFSSALMGIYTTTKTVAGGLSEMRGILDNVIVGYAAFKTGGMISAGIVTATTAITSMNTALKTATLSQLAFNTAAKLNPYILGATVLGTMAYATYESNQELQAEYEANMKYWENIGKENSEKAKSQEGMLKTAEAYELKYQEIFERTGQRIEAYKTQAEQLRKMALGTLTSESLKFGGAAKLTDEEAKKQTVEALKSYEDYYKNIGDLSTAWAIKEADIRAKNTVLSEIQLNTLLKTEKDKYFGYEKLSDEWSKKKLELSKELAIAEGSELAKPYVEIMAKYEEDLAHFKGNREAQLLIQQTFNATLQKLNFDTAEKADKLEKERSDKATKLFEESYQNRTDSYKTYYQALGDLENVFYIEESEKIEKLARAGILSNAQMLEVWSKDLEKFQEEQFKKNNAWLYDFFDNVNKALDTQLLDGLKGKFSSFSAWMKSIFSSIGDSMLAGLSRSMAGNITGSMQNIITSAMQSNFTRGLGALASSSTLSAGDISTLVSKGELTKLENGSYIGSGGLEVSSGGEVLNGLSTLSTLKSAYGLLTDGISGTILSGFNGVANTLGNLGFTGVGGTLSQFGAGFASPLSFATQSPLAGLYGSGIGTTSTATMAGGMLSSGLIGYGMGSLGDSLFGAKTQASNLGAMGAAVGSIIPGVGTIVGGVIGSVLGGFFGSKKETDSGLEFFDNMDALDTLSADTVKAYSDWEKKSWFGSSEGTKHTVLNPTKMKQIESVFDTYDYLLVQLGDSDKIWLDAGKYSKETFEDVLAKNFIQAFSDVNQNVDSAIYDMWKEYAESLNKTVLKAMSDSISTYVTSTRDFTKWSLERQGDSIGSLQLQAQWAEADFSNLANMIGATGVTVENYTQKYAEAIKNSFDADTITKWQQLGTALRNATDAGDTYKNAVLSQLNTQLSAWVNALGSIQGAIDAISPTFKTLEELKSSTLNLDNYSTLLSQLEVTRQNEINTLTTATQLRITQLNNEKMLFSSLSDFIDELNLKLLGSSNVTVDYFFSELDKAKSVLASGGVVNSSKLTQSANSYLDSALQNSTSQLEYFREVAKVREGISGLGDMVTGGSLESIEAAIKTEEQTLAQKLDELNQTALSILNGWKGTATSSISSLNSQINTVKSVDPSITAAYVNILGRTPEEAGAGYWQSQLNTGALNTGNITKTIAEAAIDELYSTVLGRVADAEGKAYWANVVSSGSIDPTQLDELFKQSAQAEIAINGSHAGGIDRVPFNNYLALLHKDEKVQTASEVAKDNLIERMIVELKETREINIEMKAELTRIQNLFDRLSPDGDAIQVRITA